MPDAGIGPDTGIDMATTITLIEACGEAGVTPLLMSDPGRGKSSLVHGLAMSRNVPFESVLGSIREPADFGGLPVIRDGGVELWPPRWARTLAEAGAGYLLLDELTTCPPAVQNAMLAVALERVVGDVPLPRGVVVIACANPPDKTAAGWALAPALANRLCHIRYRPTDKETLHGFTNGWASPPASRALTAAGTERIATLSGSVTAFLGKRPHLIHAFPETAAEASGPWPSPRTWEMSIKVLAHLRDNHEDARDAAVYGLVGEGAGREYMQWVKDLDLPDPAQVLADPHRVEWRGGRDDRSWAILAGVVAYCTAGKEVSAERWREAWKVLAAATDGGAFDVAAAVARPLSRARPQGAVPPRAAKAFEERLRQAGLLRPAADEQEMEP